jgi:uncharacterized RDD family membrane protein YckC
MQMGRRIICPTCDARSEIGARYCMRCGSNLQHVEGFLDYAGFERRFLASFIDDLIFLVPLFCVWISSGISLVPVLAIAIARWGYFVGMESSKRQATLGKMAMGIMVTDTEGERISFTTATIRYFAKIFLGFYLLIAFS